MVELNLVEEKKKAIDFWKFNTYVFIQTHTNLYNGYICQVVDDERFMFLDDDIPAPFPIRFDTLKYPLVPSKNKKREENKFEQEEK